MNKIIIFEPDVRLNDLYQSVVDSSVYNFEVIPFYEAADIIEYMEDEDNSSEVTISLIDYKSGEFDGVEINKKFVKGGYQGAAVLLCDEEPTKKDFDELLGINENSGVYYKTQGAKELRSIIRTILKKNRLVDQELLEEFDYTQISPMILLYAKTVPADVYYMDKDDTYSILFEAESAVSSEKIQEHISKGITKFHIISSVRSEFYDFFLDLLADKEYNHSPKLEGANSAMQQQILGMVFDRLKDVGSDEKMIDIAKNNLEANLETINSSKNLKKLLTNVVGKGEIEFEHSMATGFLSQMILKQLEWRSPDTQYKLSLAAFFHDLYSPKFDESNTKLESANSFDIRNLKENNLEFYKHAAKAAEFVDGLKDIPPDTAQIIATHHELPKAKGFPKKLFGSRTSSLGCVFNTAHYFCLQLYKHGWNRTGIDIALTDMNKTFKDGNYEKPFKALQKLFS